MSLNAEASTQRVSATEGEFELKVGALFSAEDVSRINTDLTGVLFAVGSEVYAEAASKEVAPCSEEAAASRIPVEVAGVETVEAKVWKRAAGYLEDAQQTDTPSALEETRLEFRFKPKFKEYNLCWHTFVRGEDGQSFSYSSR